MATTGGLQRTALVWAVSRNFAPRQRRCEKQWHCRHPGKSPLQVVGVVTFHVRSGSVRHFGLPRLFLSNATSTSDRPRAAFILSRERSSTNRTGRRARKQFRQGFQSRMASAAAGDCYGSIDGVGVGGSVGVAVGWKVTHCHRSLGAGQPQGV